MNGHLMSYTKRKFLVSRRYGVSLWGHAKDPVQERKYPPGQHGIMGYSKKSDFAKQLEAKQKLKSHYDIREKQFRNIYQLATKKKGDRIENFISLLETRLDVLVYRAKFAPTIFAAKQLVSHGHFLLNNKKIDIPSVRVVAGSTVQLKKQGMFENPSIVTAIEASDRSVPEYIETNDEKRSFKLLRLPALVDVPYAFVVDNVFINHIIAFYSH
ncbi:Small ribosomal subunit protein uS4 [Candidatus Xenohaliotis californiensis]|uniref:Small ribosomal subunit protein uS4 n=1 Tax=Candidatus Xenohaliotis californiensis TaxID=84677 RepID=A0ABM9N8U2_9RICK|nr:Small ribosomal subunit protein uS4 [Candidatus Xenohaliotis californiensis]